MLIVHAEPDWLQPLAEGHDGFWHKLTGPLAELDLDIRMVRAGSRVSEILSAPAAGHVHVAMGGQPGYAPNLLHVEIGPIPGFWYLDELGTGPHSTLRQIPFAPGRVNRAQAEQFFNNLSRKVLRRNLSKLPQEPRRPGRLKPAKAVIFTQEIEAAPHRTHYLGSAEMIRTVAEHDRRAPIYVKLHPRHTKPTRVALMAVAQDYRNVTISEDSVHDLIEAAEMVVTQNSDAGFEALLQKKPVVTCAKSDYRHATLTARSVSDLKEALDFGAEAMAGFPYEKYVFWFLRRHLLEEAKEDFAARAVARIRDKAFL